jgi:DNA-binding transcriptional regulator YdaS (Cro superfamily)
MDLELLEARWRTGRILSSDLPRIARELARAGHDAPAMAALLATPAHELPSQGRAVFERTLRQLGHGRMTPSEAALHIARRLAGQLLAGELRPDAVVKAVALVRWKGGPDVDAHLVPFSRLADRYETAASGPLRLVRPWLDRRARSEARRLLDGSGR